MLTEVVNHRPGMLPDYLVSANELHLLPIESLTEAEVSIAVRMDKLEKAVLELAKRPQEAVQEVARRPQEGALGARRPEAVLEVVQEQARGPQEGVLGAAIERGRSLSYRRVLTAGRRAATPVRGAT